MSLRKLFKSSDKKVIESHISNLVYLAGIDGHVDQKEVEMLVTIAHSKGISGEQIQQIVNSGDYDSDHYSPSNPRQKLEHIFDLILMMMADGKMTADELYVSRKIGSMMDIKPVVFDEILEMMSDLTLIRKDREQIISIIYKGMGHRL